jgi:hypothetical protein
MNVETSSPPAASARTIKRKGRLPNGNFIAAWEAREHLASLRAVLGMPAPPVESMNIVALCAEVRVLEALMTGKNSSPSEVLSVLTEAKAAVKAEITPPSPPAAAVSLPGQKPVLFGRARFAAAFKVVGAGQGVYVARAAQDLAKTTPGENISGRERFARSLKIVGAKPSGEKTIEDKDQPPLTGRARFARSFRLEGSPKK